MAPQGPLKWSADRIEELKRRVKDGETAREIGDAMGETYGIRDFVTRRGRMVQPITCTSDNDHRAHISC